MSGNSWFREITSYFNSNSAPEGATNSARDLAKGSESPTKSSLLVVSYDDSQKQVTEGDSPVSPKSSAAPSEGSSDKLHRPRLGVDTERTPNIPPGTHTSRLTQASEKDRQTKEVKQVLTQDSSVTQPPLHDAVTNPPLRYTRTTTLLLTLLTGANSCIAEGLRQHKT